MFLNHCLPAEAMQINRPPGTKAGGLEQKSDRFAV